MSLPPVEIPLGAMRFNSDSQKLEYWNGQIWMQIHTANNQVNGGHRGLIMAGSSHTATIDMITISTAGDATDFGDLITGVMLPSGCSSSTRGLSMGGRRTSPVIQINDIEYVTIQSTGNGTNFGDLVKTNNYGNLGNLGNATRGMIQGGVADNDPASTGLGVDMNYVTIASEGNAVKFGECAVSHTYSAGTFSSPTRGVIAGGGNPGINTTEYITIATTGNAQDFGDLMNNGGQGSAGASSPVIGLVAGGYYGGSDHDIIEKFTIATRGNSSDFGNLTQVKRWITPVSDSIRACWCGGYGPITNVISYCVFATQGDALDFGDLVDNGGGAAGASSGHGGLG